MNHRLPLHILIHLCLLFYGCENYDHSSQPSAEKGTAQLHFDKAINAKASGEILSHLNLALESVESSHDTLIPLLLDYKIYYHSSFREPDSAFYFSDSLISWAIKKKDTVNLALGQYRKSRVHFQLGDHEQVFRDAFESRRLSLLIGDSTSAGQRSLEMSLAQSRLGDHTGSQESATEALRFLNNNKDSLYISSAYNNIAISYRLQDFYDDAEKEYLNALKFASRKSDSLVYLNNLALVLQEKGDYARSVRILEGIIAGEGLEPVSKARYLDNLYYTKWLWDPEINVEKDLLEAMELRKDHNDREGLLASYSHLVEYYNEKNPAEAEKYSRLLLENSRKFGNTSGELQALKYLVTIAPGNTRWTNEYIVLNDSLNRAQLLARNIFAKIKFDEERKQQEIDNLESQRAFQLLEAKRLRNRNLIFFLMGLLVILLLFFLIYYFRQRHKKEKIMEIHKTESRISKVIHDELANDIFNVMSSLETLAPVPVIDRLERIYLRTRDISRENREPDTGDSYFKSMISTLSNNIPENSRLIIKGENTLDWNKLAEERKVIIYRVLQELMVNMKKHSKAKLVALSFSKAGKYLYINYSDTGIGIHGEVLEKGAGLQNVENRIFSLNGSIKFESEAGKGYKVHIKIPV
ncbi:tetratricopeptide repeat protein [Aquiflexum sp.]|uniref:sensor histidine kinase n=1 Tax=Aquiflexum sp. TaxID=1872584 RepID=UPI003593DBB0